MNANRGKGSRRPAGQVGVSDHIHIGTAAQVGAKSGVAKDLEPGARVYGYPCNPAQLQLRIISLLKRLPELVQDVQALKRQLGQDDPLAA